MSEITQEDAFHHLVRCLRGEVKSIASSYGYDLWIRNAVVTFLGQGIGQTDPQVEQLSPLFFAAAWELCRRGIIRPGVRRLGLQDTTEGSAGGGYSVTPFGRKWLEEAQQDDYVPTEPGRFAELLAAVGPLFGAAYQERGQEAVRCYGAHAYLACCAMCGAAVEAIIIAAATVRIGHESVVLKDLASKGGRSRVENQLIGHLGPPLQKRFRASADLLKYWRDISAHGQASGISDNEAYTSLLLLLGFARFVNDNWASLTQP